MGKKKASRDHVEFNKFPVWVNSNLKFWESEYELIRDCILGEKQIKAKDIQYLPQVESFDAAEYNAYLSRATFYNMVDRTVGGLTGSIFRRIPIIQNVPEKLLPYLENIGRDHSDLRQFSKNVAEEVITMGRVGVLLDRQDGQDPYLTMYVAESILNWKTAMVNGREQFVKVILRECNEIEDEKTLAVTTYDAYRILSLNQIGGKWVYTQEVIYNDTGHADIMQDGEIITPTLNGVPLDYIPFQILSPRGLSSNVEKPPVYDIATLNISHYRSYAQLEHGRYYTGLPIYWTNVENEDQGKVEYTLGPSTVWELGPSGKAGCLEFNGQGLKFLENALNQKEVQVAALGARLIGIASRSVSESDNQVQMKDRNEQAMLLSITLSLDAGFTQLLRWYAAWVNAPMGVVGDDGKFRLVKIEFNKDFLFSPVSAREYRAIQALYKDGHIPIEVLFDYFKRAEVIPDWLDIDEFKLLLQSAASFPNNPDFEAREDGYPNRSEQINDENKDADREIEQQIADNTLSLGKEKNDIAKKVANKPAPKPVATLGKASIARKPAAK